MVTITLRRAEAQGARALEFRILSARRSLPEAATGS